MAAMKPTNVLTIIEKNNTDRMTIVLPVRRLFSWPTENIAFFCSTGQSGVKEFDGTYFPTLGVYVDDRTTPIPAGTIDSSITLVRNYFVKTSSISFLKPKAVYELQEWIFLLLKDYCESEGKLHMFQMSLNDVRRDHDETVTRELHKMYKELDLIFKCLSSYFTDVRQVFLSIGLSDTFQSGVWLSSLKGFADYMKSLSGNSYQIIDKTGIASDATFDFLGRNSAQCDFITLRETLPLNRLYQLKTTNYMYDVLYKNFQALDTIVAGYDRVVRLDAEKAKREAEKAAEAKGGKSRKRKSRRKSRKITTRFRYV